MPTTLVIAEKPNAAAKIAAALSNGKAKRDGKRAYHFSFERDGKRVVVAPAVGHVYGLKASATGGGYPVFDVEWVPSSDVSEGSAFTKDYLTQLQKLMKAADRVVVATDYDIEGSLIGYNVYRFNAPNKPVSRMKFSTLVADDLVDAFEHPAEMDVANARAGEARHILDWLFGINLSRALMAAIRAAGRFKILSVGRVQGPTLEVLARRENAISAFKPEPYWEVHARVKATEFEHEKGKFTQQTEAATAAANAKKGGSVERVERRAYNQLPPFPYDLTSLQMDAYRAFGLTPSATLKVAQRLYEEGAISYPRTASQKLPAKLNLAKILSNLQKQSAYAADAGKLLSAGRTKPHEGPKDDPAHPALHPTGTAPGKTGAQEAKLYDLIVRRFFACLAEPARREALKVSLKLGGEGFSASGARTLEPGWLALFPYAKMEEVTLPEFREGEAVHPEKVTLDEKETQPPKRYSPASLVKKMEALGIGTKATRSEVVETLYARGYIEDKKSIRVTPLGLTVVRALEHHCPEILSEKLTRQFEAEMEDIQAGKKEPDAVVQEGRAFLSRVLTAFKPKEKSVGEELLAGLKDTQDQARQLGPCIKCPTEGRAGTIVIKRSRFGLFAACDQYPACKTTYPLPRNALAQPLGKPCPVCGTAVIRVIRKGKRPFEMCLLPGCASKAHWGEKKNATPTPPGQKTKPASATPSPPTANPPRSAHARAPTPGIPPTPAPARAPTPGISPSPTPANPPTPPATTPRARTAKTRAKPAPKAR